MRRIHWAKVALHTLSKRGLLLCCLAVFGVLTAPRPAHAQKPPDLTQQGYVNDYGEFIGDNEKSQIGDVCRTLDERTGDRVLVVTVKSTGNLSPGQFGEQLRNSWISVADFRERTLVMVVNGEGRVGFGIGGALEGILTHEKLGAALHSSLAVGGNDYGQKLLYLVQRIAEDVEGTSVQAPAANPVSASPSPGGPSAPANPPGRPASKNSEGRFEWQLVMFTLLLAIYLGRGRLLPTVYWTLGTGAPILGLLLVMSHPERFSETVQTWMAIAMGASVAFAILLMLYAVFRPLFTRRPH